MRAEIITSGTELLLGETVDTNSAYIARCLRDIGVDLYYLHTVGDNQTRMADMLSEALRRSDLVITTGGLGPTVDDVTRPAVAQATGRQLVLMPELLADIEAFFARTGRRMTDNNRQQAYIPAGAIPIHNPVGTAPAFIVEDPAGTIICLPGVPREMEYLMQHEVLPYLKRRLGSPQIIKARTLRTCSIGESNVDHLIGDLEKLSNPSVGLAAHPGQTDVRITAKGADEAEVDALIAGVEAEIRRRLGDVIFGVDKETLEGVVAGLLVAQDRSIAIVESNTEGQVAGRLRRALEELGQAGRLRLAERVAAWKEPIDRAAVLAEAERVAARAGADVVLYVAGTGEDNQGVWGQTSGQTQIALIAGGRRELRPFRYGGRDPHTQSWVFYRALDLTRRLLLGLSLEIA
jgi:nicotinamide-nucleotide amidase